MVKARLMRGEEFKLNNSERLLAYYRKYPNFGITDLLCVSLMWFQRLCLKSMFDKRYTMLVMGRGCGKTWLTAVFSILHAMLYPNSQIGIIAPSFKQAEFFFDKIQEIYDNSPYVRAASKSRPKRATFRARLNFRNGSFIEGLPLGTGNKIRGQRYNIIIIDEYAQVDEEIIKTVVLPMMTVKRKGITNRTIIASSAYFTWNHFYTRYIHYNIMAEEKPKQYAVHEHNYLDVKLVPENERQFDMDEDIIEMIRVESTQEQFDMEVMCKFPVEGNSFISQALLDRCTPKNNELDRESPIEFVGENSYIYSMGIDAARVQGGDNFAISVIKIDHHMNNLKRYVFCHTMNGATYQEMVFAIRKVLQVFPIADICMDSGGGGLTLKDLLAEPYDNKAGVAGLPILDMDDKETENLVGVRILRMINFTRPVVNDMYMRLKADMQHKHLAYPQNVLRHNDVQLDEIAKNIIETKKELLMLQAEGRGNHYIFEVPPQFKKDRATAIALANMSANNLIENQIPIHVVEPAEGFWV